MTLKPEPKTIAVVCSLCDQSWEEHVAKDPTVEDCINLLKRKLAQAEKAAKPQPFPKVPWRPESPYGRPTVWRGSDGEERVYTVNTLDADGRTFTEKYGVKR